MTDHLDPMPLFREWFEAAQQTGLPEPSAAALATVDEHGAPAVRMVLVRGVDERGFVFYTNLQSRKGVELGAGRPVARNPAALCFYWPPLARQVRIEGNAEPVTDAEADAYWASRPRAHQIAAWASPQSQPLAGGKDELSRRFAEMDRRLPQENVPRPPYWSGYRIQPRAIEFWEGKPGRLHDRVLYKRTEGGFWTTTVLAP